MKSNFYKSFSHQAMLPNKARAPGVVLNIESNESTKEKQEKINLHWKQIEQKIHATNTLRKPSNQPDYDIQNVNVENFTIDVIVNDQNNNSEFDRRKVKHGFTDILALLESGEINENVSVYKKVPTKEEQVFVKELLSQNINDKLDSNNEKIKNNLVGSNYLKGQSNNSPNDKNERSPVKYLMSNYDKGEVVVFK